MIHKSWFINRQTYKRQHVTAKSTVRSSNENSYEHNMEIYMSNERETFPDWIKTRNTIRGAL